MELDIVAPAVCTLSCAGWVAAVSRRAPAGALRAAARGVAGGLVACAAAIGGYALLERAGLPLSWSDLVRGGRGGLVAAGAIGLIEEGAKLLGLAAASLRARDGSAASVARRVLLVSAAFASFECALTLRAADGPVLLLRALLAPVAHAALAIPLGVALAGARPRLGWVAPALLLAAALHGASDLALALPGPGRLGHAALLAAPVVALKISLGLRPQAAG